MTALRRLVAEWRAYADERCRAGERSAIRVCAAELERALDDLDAEARDTVPCAAPDPSIEVT